MTAILIVGGKHVNTYRVFLVQLEPLSTTLDLFHSLLLTRMEILGATSAVVGLAVPVFQSAKYLRDRMKLVLYLPMCFIGAYSLSALAGRI